MDIACFPPFLSSWAVIDVPFAATAPVQDLVVATRNTKDFVDFGLRFLDPFHLR